MSTRQCKNELVSVSIVAWNSIKYIGKCLDAIAKQSYPNIEIIVIDNNSTDGTVKYLKENFPEVKLVENRENKGFCAGHNIGIKLSRGDFILCLNPDVFIEKTYIEELLKVMNDNPNVGGCIGKLYQYDPHMESREKHSIKIIDTTGLSILRSRRFIARGHGEIDNGQFDRMEYIVGIDGMAPLYRKKMLENTKIEGEHFDELFFAYCEDHDLCLRAQIYGWKFMFVPTATAYHVRTWKHVKTWTLSNLKARKSMPSELKSMAIRNHYLTVLKNDFEMLFLKYIPFILLRAIEVIGYILLFEQSSMKGIIEFITLIPTALRKRKIIMRNRKITDNYMEQWFS